MSKYYIAPLGLTLKVAHPSESGFRKIEFIVRNEKENIDKNIDSKFQEINFPVDGIQHSDLENFDNEKKQIINH